MPASVPIAGNGFAKYRGTGSDNGRDVARSAQRAMKELSVLHSYAPLFFSHFSSGFQSSWCERTASAW
jgi:hypothetical protein